MNVATDAATPTPPDEQAHEPDEAEVRAELVEKALQSRLRFVERGDADRRIVDRRRPACARARRGRDRRGQPEQPPLAHAAAERDEPAAIDGRRDSTSTRGPRLDEAGRTDPAHA